MIRQIAWALGLLSGCIAWNDVCAPDQSEIVGETLRSLDLREALLRTREAPAGNLLADALLIETPGADLAIVPAEMITGRNDCGDRDFLQRGLVRQRDVDQLVPTADEVWLLSVTGEELKRVFERSVSTLGASSAENAGFLHIAGALFAADCAEEAQRLSPDGRSIAFPGARVDSAGIFVSGAPVSPSQTYKLAVPASLAGGAFGYLDLTRTGALLIETGKTLRQMLTDHLRKTSPVEPRSEGRILLSDSCQQ